ncbi:MAG: hypothetical protein ACTSP1_12300 [Candidatus Freyarchaeota archaeon]
MNEITVAITGISLFLYAFKLCEYFESEANKAIDRKEHLKEWFNDRRTNWENKDIEIICALISQIKVIKYYIHGCTICGKHINGRTLWVYVPNLILLSSFILATGYLLIASFINLTAYYSSTGLQILLVPDLFLSVYDLSSGEWLSWVPLLIIWGLYLLGAGIPLFGAWKGMENRPTYRYLTLKNKYKRYQQRNFSVDLRNFS